MADHSNVTDSDPGLPFGTRVARSAVAVALFTSSWDRVAVAVGTYSVKVSVLAAFVALTASVATARGSVATAKGASGRTNERAVGRLDVGILLLCLFYAVGVLAAESAQTAAVQSTTFVLGALLPFMAIVTCFNRGVSVKHMLSAYLYGAVFSVSFGLYQLLARAAGFPDPYPYLGLGGGVGRVASLSYEPAYFAYSLILAAGVWFAREQVSPTQRSSISIILILIGIVISNSRAAILMVPVFFAFLAFKGVRKSVRNWVVTGAIVAAYGSVILFLASPDLRQFVAGRISSIGDVSEPTSNAPRIAAYGNIQDLVSNNLWFGVGPGNLYLIGPRYGLFVPLGASPNSVVANNIWLQALVDGGIFLLVTHILILLAVVGLGRSRLLGVRPLASGWFTVVAIGGMLTSYFYDIKMWLVLGLIYACALNESSGMRLPPEPADGVGRSVLGRSVKVGRREDRVGGG